jgi:hypothetical protein
VPRLTVAVAALAGILLFEPAAAEEVSMRVFSAWQGQGHILQTGPEAVTYIGMLSGRVYVDTGYGPVDAGDMICPVVVQPFDRVTCFGTARTSEVLRSPRIASQNPHRLLSSTPFQCSSGER